MLRRETPQGAQKDSLKAAIKEVAIPLPTQKSHNLTGNVSYFPAALRLSSSGARIEHASSSKGVSLSVLSLAWVQFPSAFLFFLKRG